MIIPSFDGNFLLYICSCHLFAAFLPHFSGLRAFIQSKTVLCYKKSCSSEKQMSDIKVKESSNCTKKKNIREGFVTR